MYKIDARTAEDIEERIQQLAGEFTPEWHFSKSNPDIGSTISCIYARQLFDNIKILNEVPKIYHAAFVNFLDLTLKPAVPSASVVVFRLVDSATGGTFVRAGTLVSTGSPSEDSDVEPVFSTERDIFVTSSEITDIFMTDREKGSIIPIKGEFEAPGITGEEPSEPELEDEEEYTKVRPFVLFGEDEKNSIARYVLGIFHPTVFDIVNEDIYIRFEDSEELTGLIASGDVRFLWLSEEGLQEFDDMSIAADGSFKLRKSGECRKIGREDEPGTSLVVLESRHPITHTIDIKDMKLSSEGKPRPADFAGDDVRELDPASFTPFTDTLAVYSECYICKEGYFDKPGSKVTLNFDLIIHEHLIDMTREQEQEELKIIKKKKYNIKESAISDAFADEISLEYFNGVGWKTIKCDKEYTALFAGEAGGKIELSFICPADWRPTQSGAYEGRMLRLRLMKSDNCYMRPSMHHYPLIKGLKISYSYFGRELHPESLKGISGSRVMDLTRKSKEGRFNIFMPSEYTDDSLYIGFDEQIETGPVGIFFKLNAGTGEAGIRCRFEYYSIRGFKQMKVIDGTEGFCHSGIVVFMPPPDFSATSLEGKKRYWIRVVRDEAQGAIQRDAFMAHIEDISVNAVNVVNAVASAEEDFYIDEVTSGYSTYLGASNILDADVWVNERGVLIGDEVKNLAAEHPDDVRIEYDATGNVSTCFVRWHEVEHLPEGDIGPIADKSWDHARCYRIDRLTGEIIFGDGIRSEIPRVTDDVAFIVRLRTCAGATANVAAGELTSMPEEQMFVDSVINPVRAYGGSNLETVSEALKRGANIIFSRGRLVSAGDYEKAVLGFSGVIDKVSVIPGMSKDGLGTPADLSLVLLMKDYKEGSFSFHRIEAKLMRFLLNQCELSVKPDKLHVVEPIFVYVSVTVWTEIMDMDDSFEVQNLIRDVLETYLDPVEGGGEGKKGWAIGTMPKKPQILMQLAGVRRQALIRKTSITVKYTDYDGEHESDFDSLEVNPFMVCVSGVHQVNILYDRSELNAQD